MLTKCISISKILHCLLPFGHCLTVCGGDLQYYFHRILIMWTFTIKNAPTKKNGYFCLERSDSWIMVFRSWTLRYATFSPMILQLPPVWKPHIPMKKTHTHQNLEQVSSQIKKFFVMKWAKNQMVYSWNRVVYKIKKLANNPNDRPIIKWKRLPLPTKISGGPQKNPFNGKKRKCAWKWQNSINLFFIWPPFVFFYE